MVTPWTRRLDPVELTLCACTGLDLRNYLKPLTCVQLPTLAPVLRDIESTMRNARSLLLALPLLAMSVACAPEESDTESEAPSADEAALLDRGVSRGRAVRTFPVQAGRPDEVCVLPKRMPGADYKKDDTKDEEELCSFKLSGAAPREEGAAAKDVAVCPKLSSTNPGTDVHELLPGKTRAETEAAICKLEDRPTKHLAKFKQSITCSYTPSILGYYHLSRALGGVGDVRPAVLRTYDLEQHKGVVANALRILAGQPNDSYPKISWLSFQRAEANPAAARAKDALFTTDLLQIYGAMQDNPRGEVKYSEINRRGASPNIHSQFVRTPAYARIIDARPVKDTVGRTLAQAAQPIVQMRDISEMLLMDFLMSQQDRFGNIHAVDMIYFPKEGGGFDTVKKAKVDDGEIPMPAGGVVVRKMLLKDNDCGGPSKDNIVRKNGLLAQIRHMNPKTYKHLRWLAQNFAPQTPVPKFMVSEAAFSQADINMLRENLGLAANTLTDACRTGKLRLDLDLKAHLAGTAQEAGACDAAEPAAELPTP